MHAASEPGATSSGTVTTVPTSPPRASSSMTGVRASSSGVLPSSNSSGLSAMPSGTTITSFTASAPGRYMAVRDPATPRGSQGGPLPS